MLILNRVCDFLVDRVKQIVIQNLYSLYNVKILFIFYTAERFCKNWGRL